MPRLGNNASHVVVKKRRYQKAFEMLPSTSTLEKKVLRIVAWLSLLVAICVQPSWRHIFASPLCSFELLRIKSICLQQSSKVRRDAPARALSSHSPVSKLSVLANKYY